MSTGLVEGWGINDADYVVQPKIDGKKVACRFYLTWKNMLRRCYNEKYRHQQPTYLNCYVDEEWRYFSNFKNWMKQQNWEGKHLDKDLLYEGNKVYSPDTCVFVHRTVNSFVIDSGAARGDCPIGVNLRKTNKYVSRCNNPLTGKREHLGEFTCPIEAHLAWKRRKHELAIQLANSNYVTDQRVRDALMKRYAPDTNWLNR